MAVVTFDVEISSKLSAPKIFKAFSDFDNIATQVEPKMYKSVTTVEGDGGDGSIKCITYGDDVPFTSSKHKIDKIDKSNLTASWTVFEGDVLLGIIESATHHAKFTPSAEGGCVYKHTIAFKCKGDAKISDDFINQTKEAFTKSFKALESYVVAHPETY